MTATAARYTHPLPAPREQRETDAFAWPYWLRHGCDCVEAHAADCRRGFG
jgi:hypothetical protein